MNAPDFLQPGAADTQTVPSESRRDNRPAPRSLKRALIVLGCGLVLTGAGAFPLAGEVSAAIADNPNVKGTIVDIRFEDQAPAGEEAPAEGEAAEAPAEGEEAAAPKEGEAESPACSPVVGYEVDGQMYNTSPSEFSKDCDWTVGQEVKVAYDKDNPVEARITTEEFNAVTAILPGAGFLVLLGGLFMTITGLRKR
ncbi:DUF3592 domain-containing protein [Arthrobacter caoxuetaonis]|uniref:DUF3592 domain-containing protein n=1 Tax=Arthrobacter caoxuetaonis TaxID=2886935 RepID=A0A9X1MIQ1_9MICC|nr:DUF3592 domain-containing protein [Arthrobacter caoxuetaonis]MCC3299662.1 DUF3592 domain-containing protein [Arthrobacter caoxuetaonis]USQ58996.1 DUF3592 domain-containing protein [Arthrobacter caoxuetaonis]